MKLAQTSEVMAESMFSPPAHLKVPSFSSVPWFGQSKIGLFKPFGDAKGSLSHRSCAMM